jgi:ribose transport system permease protein
MITGVNLKVIDNPVSVSTTWMTRLAGTVGPVPGALFTIGFPLAVWGALRLVAYRRLLYAVASLLPTAFASGINVSAIRVAAYALGGMFAAVGGIAVIAIPSSATASLSGTYTLQAIAAVALGGTSLKGGRGGLLGSLLGAASIYLLGDLLINFSAPPSWLQVAYGVLLVLSVVLVSIAGQRRSA